MNSSDSPSNDNEKPPNEEAAILKTFMQIALNKFNSSSQENVGRLEGIYGERSSDDFKAEKDVARNANLSGIRWGIGSTAMSFFILRRVPVYLMRRVQRNHASSLSRNETKNSSSNPFMNPGSHRHKQSPHQAQGPNNEKIELPLRQGWIRYTLGLLIDVNLSLWTGVSVTSYMINAKELLGQFEKMPLIEGRSVLSEELCPDFTAVYKDIRDKHKYDWNNPKRSNDAINTIQNFVKNCEKRKACEKSLRMQQGLTSNIPVAIPSPGVPASTPITEDEEEELEANDDLSEFHNHRGSVGSVESDTFFGGLEKRGEVDDFFEAGDRVNNRTNSYVDNATLDAEWSNLDDDKQMHKNDNDMSNAEKSVRNTKRFRFFS